MTPYQLHEACHEACMQCPQFRAYDDDTIVTNEGQRFGSIPKKGLFAVYQFWKDHETLIGSGYKEALEDEAKDIFNRIEKVIEQAIKKEFE